MIELLEWFLRLVSVAGSVVGAGLAVLPIDLYRQSAYEKAPRIEILALACLVGNALATFAGLVLGYLGLFSLWSIVALLALVSLVRWRGVHLALTALSSCRLERVHVVALILASGLIAYAVVFRSHEIQGMRDQGIYCCTGIELARTGDFLWRDVLVQQVGFPHVAHLFEDLGDLFQGFPRYLRFAGYYLASQSEGWIIPQFLHGYEVWTALAFAIGGPQATQCVNAVFCALAVICFASVVQRLWGSTVAFAATVLFVSSLAELWYARFPSNEPAVQAFLWGFILIYVVIRQLQWHEKQKEEIHSKLLARGFLLLAAVSVMKFASWPLLALVAIDLGMAITRREVMVRPRFAIMLLLAVTLVALLHAALFAQFYLYGSWTHTIKRLGISYQMFPALFVGGVLASYSIGSLLGEVRFSDTWKTRLMAWRKYAGWGTFTLLVVLWGYQRRLWNSVVGSNDVWAESTNLYEFAQYYGPVFFLCAVGGYALFVAREKGREKRLLFLFLLGSAFFLVRRNLDALHPWGSRRWLPILVPCTALATAAFVDFCIRGTRWLRRGLVLIATVLLAISQLFQAPVMLLTANYRGAIPQVDRWGSVLTPRDLVLMQPNALVAQYGPYLQARFDISAYTQPYAAEAWAKTAELVKIPGFNFERVIYITDETLSSPRVSKPFIQDIASLRLDYPVLREESHRLPQKPMRICESIHFYQVDLRNLPYGWTPLMKVVPEKKPPRPLPIVLPMNQEAESVLVKGFFAPTPQGDGTAYRWTDGTGRLAIGDLILFPLERSKVRITAVMHSGRPDKTIDVHWYLDPDKPDRALKLGITPVPSAWTECTVEVDAKLLKPDSTLELQSLRPEVAPDIPPGRLGVRVLSLRLE